MKTIKSIDLWTEQNENHYECFNGAFVDGFENNKIAFDEYKIIKNCNCIITVNNPNINISNKHNAIVFYKDKNPVRLMVINKNTDIDKCIKIALTQYFENETLQVLYDNLQIKSSIIDIKGSYTESNTQYGNYQSDKYEFIPNIFIKYELTTDTEKFEIEHKCAFINTIKTRIIPIQENSNLTKKE